MMSKTITHWLHKTAEAGNKRAQYRLGLCHYYGKFGIEKDQSQAIAWFKEAAKAGHRKAIKLLMDILPYNDPDLYYLNKEYGDPAEAERLLDIHERMI
jgi:TPR repeat protein